MHFASKKVYKKKQAPQRKEKKPIFQLIKAKPKTSTNVISIDLGELNEKVTLLTGDAASCKGCEAIFNSFSETKFGRGGEKIWACEFCEQINEINLEEEELPKTETCDYLLEPPSEKFISDSEKLIIFCIDTSGSMCVTSELSGKHKLRGDKSQELLSLNTEGQNQFLPGQRQDVTYVSRLQCVQAAIETQLEKLKAEHPKTKVGLVCFNGDVTIIGDGTKQPVVVTGDKLSSQEELLQIGVQYKIDSPISDSKDALNKKLYELNETGPTALGPAVVVAVGMAQSSPGSKIVLATDGLANMGVGAMDEVPQDIFYQELAQHAKQQGITISVIGIRGDSINMNTLGKLADGTSGDVDIVDPIKIKENFTSILESKLVATDVVVKLFLHSGFAFPEDNEWESNNMNTEKGENKRQLYAIRNIGNAYDGTEITAEFTQAPEFLANYLGKEKMEKMEVDEEISEKKEKKEKMELPFQVQITYRALSGMKCTRVITKMKELTESKTEAINEVDVTVLGMHANFKAAHMAQKGDIDGAIAVNEAVDQLLVSNLGDEVDSAGYNMWSEDTRAFTKQLKMVSPMQQQQQQQQQQAPSSLTSTFSNFTNSIGNYISDSFSPFSSDTSQAQDDETSNMIYQHRNAKKNASTWSARRKY